MGTEHKKSKGSKKKEATKKESSTKEGSRTNLEVDEKCQIIEYLKSHRHALFDQYSTKLTPSDQKEAWEEAVVFAKRYL